MIQMDPSDPANYFALAKIYEDAGNYEQAEATLLKARESRPKDPSVYMQLGAYYNRQGQFDKTMDALNQRAAQEPNNPEGYYTIATYYWDKTFRDKTLKEPEKREYISKGLEATDKAIQIKADYMEAIVYKGLLLRLQATLEKDRKQQEALLHEAEPLGPRPSRFRRPRRRARAAEQRASSPAASGRLVGPCANRPKRKKTATVPLAQVAVVVSYVNASPGSSRSWRGWPPALPSACPR